MASYCLYARYVACLIESVDSRIAGWLSMMFRYVHVLAAIMWIGNSILFTWMELKEFDHGFTDFKNLEPAPENHGPSTRSCAIIFNWRMRSDAVVSLLERLDIAALCPARPMEFWVAQPTTWEAMAI